MSICCFCRSRSWSVWTASLSVLPSTCRAMAALTLTRPTTRARLVPGPVPNRPTARHRVAVHRQMPRGPWPGGRLRRGTAAQHPRDDDLAGAPVVPVRAALRVVPRPPVRTSHPHDPIRTRILFSMSRFGAKSRISGRDLVRRLQVNDRQLILILLEATSRRAAWSRVPRGRRQERMTSPARPGVRTGSESGRPAPPPRPRSPSVARCDTRSTAVVLATVR
jgi:hypothetical protein